MDSMQDLEQLRLSVSEQDIPSAIMQVHQWIDTHGVALLRNNQKLPSNYDEAEHIRKQHEKVELKCMTFLAFYAKINLKNIPEEYEEMREDMDITIHKFSEHIKARRHTVVSFFTFFRHLEKLGEKLADLQNEDLSDLPDSIDDINSLIGKFHKNTNNCLKRLAHLKDEGDRVKSSMDTIISINNSPNFEYVDKSRISESKLHIDEILRQMELEVTRIFESQRLLELELKIEAKMMQIEDDLTRCCGWLQKMEQKLLDIYKLNVVGMATVENDMLNKEVAELVNKMKLTKEYGGRLMNMYEQLCTQFKRDTSRGLANGEKLDELWRLAEVISTESLARLTKSRKLYHGLDSTLDKVEDMLFSINKDRENNASNEEIVDKYLKLRDEINEEFQDIKHSANELNNKLRYDLFNEKLRPLEETYAKAEQTEDMVKMKVFTIAVKLKELDRCLFPDGDAPVISSKKAAKTNAEPLSSLNGTTDDDLQGNIEKYLRFLKTTQLNWESRPLPKNMDQAVKALKEHQDISNQSEQYWRNIQTELGAIGFQSKTEKETLQKLLSDASREKKNWDFKWKSHMDEKLNPRYQFFKKLQDFNNDLDENIEILDNLLDRPNHSVPLVRNLRNELNKMKTQLPPKEQTLAALHKEATHIHRTDLKNSFSNTDDKVTEYRERLDKFLELEDFLEEVLEFLPILSQFKKEWESKVKTLKNDVTEMNNLTDDADRMKSRIGRYDVRKLRSLASATYGTSQPVEWIIEELQADFNVPSIAQANEELITPSHRPRKLMAAVDMVDSAPSKPLKEISVRAFVNSSTELHFDMNALPKVEQDQYNIQWYKNDVVIDPENDYRISTDCEPRQGRLNLKIEKCDFSDAGKYWCEVKNVPSGVITSYPINLSVFAKKSSGSNNINALFGDQVFAGRDDPLTLELKLDDFRFAPESDLIHNGSPISVNQRQCPWTRVASNTSIEYCHPAITDSDRGLYEFVVSDKVVAETQLVVGDAPKLLRHHFKEKARSGYPLSITIPTVNIQNKADQKVIWMKDDTKLISDNGKCRLFLNDECDPVLEIEETKAAHAGVYTCEVYNDYGRTSAQVIVEVVSDNQNVTDTPVKSNIADDGSTLDKLLANVGESVILDIFYSPSKNTKIEWTKDNRPVGTNDSRIKITNDNNSRCSLQISSTRISDSGLYTATVKGTNRKQSTILEIRQLSHGPVIEKYPQNVRATLSEPLNIDCSVRCQPACNNIKWTIQALDGGPQKTLSNNVNCKLTSSMIDENLQKISCRIDKTSRADAGEYVLRCENDVGWTSVKIPVTVIAADDVQFKKKPPTFVQSLKKEVSTHGDEPVILKCKVTGNPFPTVKWMKNGREVNPSDFVKIKHSGDIHELNIRNPRATDSGSYEAVATNSVGTEKNQCLVKVLAPLEVPVSEITIPTFVANKEKSPNESSDVEQIPQRTQLIFANTVVRSPPQFVTTFTDEIVEEGDDVVLKCCLVGQPEAVVWWSYNTHLLKNPRCEMSRQGNDYSLTLRDAKEEDSGRYSMTAENSSGLATCSALIIVDKNQGKGRSLDRSLYRANSKPRNPESQSGSFPCHTTLSHTLNNSLPDESKIMQVSPRGWEDQQTGSHNPSKAFGGDVDPPDNVDFSKSKTKTVKTYHYSGPSGIDLPGIGFIPKLNVSPPSSTSSEDRGSRRAVFVPGTKIPTPQNKPVVSATNVDVSRFSVAESSECDYPL